MQSQQWRVFFYFFNVHLLVSTDARIEEIGTHSVPSRPETQKPDTRHIIIILLHTHIWRQILPGLISTQKRSGKEKERYEN